MTTMTGKTSGYLTDSKSSNCSAIYVWMKKHKINYDRDFTHQDENIKEAILNEVPAQATPLII